MKTKTTLLLLVIVVAVACYIKFYESKRPNTVEANRQAQNVINIEREKIDGLTIQNGDDRIDLRRENGKWKIDAPFKDLADNSVVENLLADLDSWEKFDTIPGKEADKNRLEEYGLAKPKLRLKLTGSDAPPEISFGKEATLEGKMYVRLEKSKDVLIAGQTVRNDISKKPEEFRDKKLTDLTTGQVMRFVLKTPAGEMELEKKNEYWEIVKPLRARADGQKIGDLLAQITNVRILQFVAEDRGDLHAYGLAEPRGSITLYTPDDKQGQLLQIGAVPEKEKDQVYVRFDARESVYTLPKRLEELLKTKPADLRDKHLVRFDTNLLDRITIETPGKSKIVLARKDENWTIASQKNEPANSAEVNRMLNILKNEEVTKFVEDVASDLAKFGLDQPQLQVTFSSFASENTAETKAGEHPFATLNFGKIDADNVYARLGDEPFIVAVRKTLLDEIHPDPLQWQDTAIFNLKPEQVRRLDVTTDHEAALVRGPNETWTWSKSSGPIDQTNVQSLLNTLTHLHAVRWIGATTSAHGFDKPLLTVSFTTSPDDKAAHRLVIGATTNDGMWFARVDECEGTFVISRPDLNALKLPLAAPPAAAPSPSASATATP